MRQGRTHCLWYVNMRAGVNQPFTVRVVSVSDDDANPQNPRKATINELQLKSTPHLDDAVEYAGHILQRYDKDPNADPFEWITIVIKNIQSAWAEYEGELPDTIKYDHDSKRWKCLTADPEAVEPLLLPAPMVEE